MSGSTSLLRRSDGERGGVPQRQPLLRPRPSSTDLSRNDVSRSTPLSRLAADDARDRPLEALPPGPCCDRSRLRVSGRRPARRRSQRRGDFDAIPRRHDRVAGEVARFEPPASAELRAPIRRPTHHRSPTAPASLLAAAHLRRVSRRACRSCRARAGARRSSRGHQPDPAGPDHSDGVASLAHSLLLPGFAVFFFGRITWADSAIPIICLLVKDCCRLFETQ